jgi:hypothetical protein
MLDFLVKISGRDCIHWNVKFPCHLSHTVKNHGHDAIDTGFRGVLLEMARKA